MFLESYPVFQIKKCRCVLQVGGVRSNLWPGAFVAGQDKRYGNLYVGWGMKNAPYIPLPPPPVAKEYDQVRRLALL